MITALALLMAAPSLAATGDFFGDLFSPGEPGAARVRLEHREYQRGYAAGSRFGLAQTRFEASLPVAGEPGALWRASTFADYDAIESGASFPTGRRMPNRLWDPGAGISHTRNLENGQSAGGSLVVSSPSDRPFGAVRDLGFNLNLTWKLPQPDGNAWILFLGVSNTRGFLPYVPLPGAAYYFQSGRRLHGLLGIPFGMVHWQPAEPWSVIAFYFPLRTGELRVTYGSPRSIAPYALVSFHTRNYRLFDRAESKERLFAEEALAQAGVTVPLRKGLALDVGGGQSFARRYYLGEKITDRKDAPTVRPDNALFLAAKLSAFL